MTTVDYNDCLKIAEQHQRHAVRTAILFIEHGFPSSALAELTDSVRKCARLDNRPLDQARVELRANNLLAEWGNPRPALVA